MVSKYWSLHTQQRFWDKVDKTESCWLWAAGLNAYGYGAFWDPSCKQMVRAHIYAYELLVGPVPSGMQLDHQCHNEDSTCLGGRTCIHRSCVNPAHLEPKTNRENFLAGVHPNAQVHQSGVCAKGHALINPIIRRRSSGTVHVTCRICENTYQRKRYLKKVGR